MDYKEAIEVLTGEIGCVDLDASNRGHIEESEQKFMYACKIAISAIKEIEKKSAVKPKFVMNLSDTVSMWRCTECGRTFKTMHKAGVIDGTDIFYCSKCGTKFNWEE